MRRQARLDIWIVSFLASLALLAFQPTSATESATPLREGWREFYKGNYERAASLGREHARRHPKDASGFILLARVKMAQGKYLAAFRQLREALRANPSDTHALYYLEQLCQTLSQAEYQRLLASAPDSARAHQFLAESYRAEGNTDRALEEYQAALKGNPQSVEILDALGDLELARFGVEEAISYFSHALETDPRDVRAISGLGAAYAARRETDRAIGYFRRAITLQPKSGGLHLALGNELLRAGKTAEAAQEFEAAIALKPNLRQAYTQLARAYRNLGKPEEAEQALKKSNELRQGEMESVERQLTDEDAAPDRPQQ